MKIVPWALACCALLNVSAAGAFTPPQDPDAPAQIVPPARQAAPAPQTQAPRAAAAPGKTRAQVEQELADAKATGQYTFGELDYPPKRPQ